MELLLWLWFYDPRWFFNFKVSIICYRTSWLIPLFMHAFITLVCLYYLQISETFMCDSSLRLWLYSRAFFSFIISINIVLFKKKIMRIYNKEIAYFNSAKIIYPALYDSMNQYDYWIRRKSLISSTGILLLVLEIISLLWSYVIISFYHFQNYYDNCDIKIQKLLKLHSFLILAVNFHLVIISLILILMKFGSILADYTCPDLLVALSKSCNSSKATIKAEKYST